MPNIVISYRREDTKWIVGRIFDRLEQHYGRDNVFMDIDAIAPGLDYRDHIRNTLQSADIVLAVIGPQWLAVEKETGQPRIADETDWVRIEIEAALGKKIPVIPILVDRARLPKPSELPETVRDFVYRQTVDLDTGADFRSHMDRLIRSMDQLLDKQDRAKKSSVEAPPGPVVEQVGIISKVFGDVINRPAEKPLSQPNDKTPLNPNAIGGQQRVVQNLEQSSPPFDVKMPAWAIGALSGLASPVIFILILSFAMDDYYKSRAIVPLVLFLLLSCFAAAVVAAFLDRSGGRYAGISFIIYALLMCSAMFAWFFVIAIYANFGWLVSRALVVGSIWSPITGCTYLILKRRFGGPKLRLFN
jgi:TIR domain